MAGAVAVKRGCGTRQMGGIYWETGLVRNGTPIEYFLMDPPVRINPTELGISPVGVKLIERDGVWHVFDWVGEQFYPDVAGFIEEVRRFGVSRRLPSSLDFEKLTSWSRIVLIHKRAYIENPDEYYAHGKDALTDTDDLGWASCPTQKLGHRFLINDAVREHNKKDKFVPECCAGLWWQDVREGVSQDAADVRRVLVSMPSFDYEALTTPEKVIPMYSTAIFASFPLSRLVVVKDPHNKKHEAGIKKLEEAGQSPVLVDE